jgi:hypothetical protein
MNIRDLIGDNGIVLSYLEFKTKYGMPCNYLQYYGLVSAIPHEWKRAVLNVDEDGLDSVLDRILKIKTVSQQYLKSVLTNNRYIKPDKSEEKWSFLLSLEDVDWKNVYINNYFASIETKLRSFQYQILQRSIVTNEKLHIYGKHETGFCTYCSQVKETVEHLFWFCPKVQDLWEYLWNWLSNVCGHQEIQFTPENLLLGTNFTYSDRWLLHVLQCVNRYIYVNKFTDKSLTFHAAVSFIKNTYSTEFHIAIKKHDDASFHKFIIKWERLHDLWLDDISNTE